MIKKFYLRLALTLLTISLAAPLALATSETNNNQTSFSTLVPAFKAKYKISRGSKDLGLGFRSLTHLADNQAEFRYSTDMSWLVLSDKRDEISTFTVANNQITPNKYQYVRTGTGPDKHYAWQYLIDKNQAKNLRKKELLDVDFSRGIQDPLGYHLQQRINLLTKPAKSNFTYTVISNKGHIKERHYQYDGEQTIELPYGKVNTVKYKREVPHKRKVTYVWFAPELNYLLVKIQQIKKDSEEFKAELITIE